MSLESFRQEMEEYCDKDQYEANSDEIILKTDTFSRLELLEHLCEAVHPHDLSISYDGSVKLREGNPVTNSRNIQNLVAEDDGVIDREQYEVRYVERERYRTGGDEVYIILGNRSKSQLVETLINSLETGHYPAGYDLQRGSEPNLIMLGKPAN